jgi:F-type H+-transporting ATPase subunit gamma
MANLKQLRTRITGIGNTQQLTRAMKLVSAAKLRRAQEGVESLRPYAETLDEMMASVAAASSGEDHPLLESREVKKLRVVIITSDKGLCGSFNANINKGTDQFLKERSGDYEEIQLDVLGKKGFEFMKARGHEVRRYHKDILSELTFSTAVTLGDEFTKDYLAGECDGIMLVFNEFRSAIAQTTVWKKLLPLSPDELSSGDGAGEAEYTFEPGQEAVLSELLPTYINTQIYRVLIESYASEMGARMTAMDSATKNAAELIEKLTLVYNKARQESITTELMDIVGGAEALR